MLLYVIKGTLQTWWLKELEMKRLSLIIQVGSSCNYMFPEKKAEGCVITKQKAEGSQAGCCAVGFEGSWRPQLRNAQGTILEWDGHRGDSPLSLQNEHSCEALAFGPVKLT